MLWGVLHIIAGTRLHNQTNNSRTHICTLASVCKCTSAYVSMCNHAEMKCASSIWRQHLGVGSWRLLPALTVKRRALACRITVKCANHISKNDSRYVSEICFSSADCKGGINSSTFLPSHALPAHIANCRKAAAIKIA